MAEKLESPYFDSALYTQIIKNHLDAQENSRGGGRGTKKDFTQ